jgi:hypothetical protein
VPTVWSVAIASAAMAVLAMAVLVLRVMASLQVRGCRVIDLDLRAGRFRG